jgi:D-beta-D-heptose 7-phosphate kinase/D-beta-D-heptose 1-phosphate adenosyltransferase
MKIGLATGCFDRFHKGHWHFLCEAGRLCQYLIVAVNTDASVRALKGADRPHDVLLTRIERVEANIWVDAVIPFNGDNEKLAECIRPDVLIRGWDQSVLPSTVPIVRISQLPGFSTTLLAHG